MDEGLKDPAKIFSFLNAKILEETTIKDANARHNWGKHLARIFNPPKAVSVLSYLFQLQCVLIAFKSR